MKNYMGRWGVRATCAFAFAAVAGGCRVPRITQINQVTLVMPEAPEGTAVRGTVTISSGGQHARPDVEQVVLAQHPDLGWVAVPPGARMPVVVSGPQGAGTAELYVPPSQTMVPAYAAAGTARRCRGSDGGDDHLFGGRGVGGRAAAIDLRAGGDGPERLRPRCARSRRSRAHAR